MPINHQVRSSSLISSTIKRLILLMFQQTASFAVWRGFVAAARVVKIKTGDAIENLTKHEVVVRQLWKTAMQGDLAAMRLLLTFMATAPVSANEDGPHEEASTSSLPAKPDEERVRRMLSRFAHLQADESES